MSKSKGQLKNRCLMIEIGLSKGRGRGTFALRSFVIGQVIEIAPCIVFNLKEWRLINKTCLSEYVYHWKESNGTNHFCLAMGYGSMYNHSKTPNASFAYDPANRQLKIEALKKIKKGDEIFIDYNSPESANWD